MGGINHQPCGEYLVISTKLSRTISLAHLNVQLANVALEDVLLAEFEGDNGSVSSIGKHLIESSVEVNRARELIGQMRRVMDMREFSDLPTLETVDLDDLGDQLVGEGLVQARQWSIAAAIMQSGGFYKILDRFEQDLVHIAKLTGALRRAVNGLNVSATNGNVSRVVEENREGNIKRPFAALFTSWTEFLDLFLASSLVSTELWYASQGHGSLAQQQQQRCVGA